MSKTSQPTRNRERLVTMTAEDVRRRVKRTPADMARIRERARGPIDTSDIPPLTRADLDSGRVRIVRRPGRGKTSLTIRLDDDLVAWFKGQGEGYQTRINEALRRYVVMNMPTTDTKTALEQIETLAKEARRRIA